MMFLVKDHTLVNLQHVFRIYCIPHFTAEYVDVVAELADGRSVTLATQLLPSQATQMLMNIAHQLHNHEKLIDPEDLLASQPEPSSAPLQPVAARRKRTRNVEEAHDEQ